VSYNNSIKVYAGENDTSEMIYESMNIEHKVWQSIEKGTNCKGYFDLFQSDNSLLWINWSWQDLHHGWESRKGARTSLTNFGIHFRLHLPSNFRNLIRNRKLKMSF